MLVLSRKVDERIRVGDEVTITVVRISPGVVRIGIDAPPHLAIVRGELEESDRHKPDAQAKLANPGCLASAAR